MNFLDGRVKNGEFIFGNNRLCLPEGYKEKLKIFEGQELILGVRPEQFVKVEKDGENVVRGVLENKEFLGNCYILYINVDGTTLVCQVEHSEDNVGQPVMVKFRMEHLYFFDKNTTKLVLYAKASDDNE